MLLFVGLLVGCSRSNDTADADDPCANSSDAEQDSISTSQTAVPDCFPFDLIAGGDVVESVVATANGKTSYQVSLNYPEDSFQTQIDHWTSQTANIADLEIEDAQQDDGTRNYLLTSESKELLIGITQSPGEQVLVLLFTPDQDDQPGSQQ